MNPTEFANKIRQKYPGAYDSLDDNTLTQKIIAKYPTYASQVKIAPAQSTAGTLLNPLKEGVQGLKTLYGGGEQGIANKLKQDVQAGAQDIQNGDVLKGIAKSGLRTAGDVAGAIYAPVGAVLQATGINKVFDYLGELSQKGGKYNPINLITDSKAVQDFVSARPNLEEDFGRALNIAFASVESGKIDPKTVIPRTIAQVESGIAKTKAIPGQVIQKTKSITGNLPEDIVNKRVSELESISGNYAQLRKEANFNPEGAKESVKRVASTDVLTNAVDENGLIRTKGEGGAVEQYKSQTLDGAENVVRKNLERLGETVNLNELEIRLNEAVNKSGLEGADLKVALNKVKREISGYKLKADAEGNVPLTTIHDAKIATSKKIRDFTTPSEIKTYEKALGEALKTTVEKNSTFNVKEINAELSKYLQDVKFLESLDGKRVKGGKLGKYFAQISGNIAGGAIGTAVGGPVGTAVGTMIGGNIAGKIKGSSLQRTLSGKTGYVSPKNPILEKAISDANYSKDLGITQPQYQTPTTISKNETINQSKVNTSSNTAPITKTSSRIIDGSISQQKGVIGRLVDKWKDLPNKQGGFARITFKGKEPLQIKISKFTLDRIQMEDAQYIVDNIARLKNKGVLSGQADTRWETFLKDIKIDGTKPISTQITELTKILNGNVDVPKALLKVNKK
tara:strand:+ start:4615 stop:6654 length:2040 start_codon:yes stop_codon:yes gene_type:complete